MSLACGIAVAATIPGRPGGAARAIILSTVVPTADCETHPVPNRAKARFQAMPPDRMSALAKNGALVDSCPFGR